MPARKETDPTDRVLMEIVAGRHDERLLDLVAAVQARAVAGSITTKWVLAVDGITVDEDELTIDMYDVVERQTGKGWDELTLPVMASSATILRAMIEAVLVYRDGMTPEDAHARVGKLTAASVADGFSTRVVDPT
jgi:hypothetical protein